MYGLDPSKLALRCFHISCSLSATLPFKLQCLVKFLNSGALWYEGVQATFKYFILLGTVQLLCVTLCCLNLPIPIMELCLSFEYPGLFIV